MQFILIRLIFSGLAQVGSSLTTTNFLVQSSVGINRINCEALGLIRGRKDWKDCQIAGRQCVSKHWEAVTRWRVLQARGIQEGKGKWGDPGKEGRHFRGVKLCAPWEVQGRT